MSDNRIIAVDDKLYDIAFEFSQITQELTVLINMMKNETKRMKSKNFYDGRNRKNLDLANKAAYEHIVNLNNFYGLCSTYTLNAYASMVKLDNELANSISNSHRGGHNVKE